MVMVCYSKRIQIKISKGKRCVEESQEKLKRSFLLSSPLSAISWTWFSQQQCVRACTKYCQAEKLTQALVFSVFIRSQLYSRGTHLRVSLQHPADPGYITLFFCDCKDFWIILFWVPCVLRQKEHDPGPVHRRTDVHHKSRCCHNRWHGHGYAKGLLSGRLLCELQEPSNHQGLVLELFAMCSLALLC